MTKAAELAKMGEVLTNSQIGGRRNIVINGAMQVAQRGTSFTGVGNGDNAYYLDRFKFAESGSPNGEFTITQASDGPNGFANSMKLDCTTAETALAANEQIRLIYSIEGQDVQQLKKGTSDAEYVTLSFYVKSNLTGTAVVGLYDEDNNRYNAKSYTIDSANTWEKKVLTFQPDTTGTLDDDNATSIQIYFYLQAGSNKTSGTLPSNWETLVEANSAPGQTINIASSTDNDFFITGVQLEVGEVDTPFEHRSFGEELALCYRYYEQWDLFTAENIWVGAALSGNPSCIMPFMYKKRAAPTVTIPATGGSGSGDKITYLNQSGSFPSTVGTISANKISDRAFRMNSTGYGGITANSAVLLYSVGTGSMKFDAEL